jgi:hypothetical protein
LNICFKYFYHIYRFYAWFQKPGGKGFTIYSRPYQD